VSLTEGDIPARLVWSCDAEPGIRRRRAGTGFSYRRADSEPVEGKTRARIERLAVPPAWTDVWICASPNGHLQATGRDVRGRKQYRYHPDFRAHRDAIKFESLVPFGHVLAPIRKQVRADLELPSMPKAKVTALVVRLLEETLVRVSNEEYARTNGSYGLTTLRNRHAQFTSSGPRLVFTSKHGIRADVAVCDRRRRTLVRRCQDLPGQVLFQYLDDDDEPSPLSSTDVNAYLRSIVDLDVTAKDFRTWKATVLAAVELAALPRPASAREARSAIRQVAGTVSERLRNTPAASRTSYIHPALLDAFSGGTLRPLWQRAPARGPGLLSADERRVLRVLSQLERGRTAA
jgi:DNA topoisomerase-1